ncbi:MAG: tetratricopeptide repeat protein [Pseudomonadota bacterium]
MTIGRNDPCPCGSGKKYKKCCGINASLERADAGDIMRALSLLQGGHPGEALAVCTAILRDQPQHPGALELAGMIHYESREFAVSRLYLDRLVSINPKDASAQANLAQVLSDLGDQQAAEAGARRALALDDRHAGAHNTLGNLLSARGVWDEALRHYRQAVAGDPQRAIFHHNLGHALQQLGKEEAEAAYRRAIELEPQFSPAYANLGGLLVKLERCKDARDLLRRAVELDPANVDAYNNLGLANRKLGNFSEAFDAYRVALEKNPATAGVWHNLGLLYEEGNQHAEAANCFKRAVEIDPGFPEAQRDWLDSLLRQGDLDTAHAVATRLMVGLPSPEVILPIIVDVLGRSADFAGRDRAIDQFRGLFQNGRYAARSLTFFVMLLHYPECIDEQEILNYHRIWGEIVDRDTEDDCFSSWPSRAVSEPLRIGYLSADFRGHSVGFFIQHVLASHDRRRFEVHCYANQRANDEVTKSIRTSVTRYTEVRNLTDQQLAQRIHDDGIHILVDLAGHSAKSRLKVFAYRPAPMQCTWIGYLNTTGLKAVDYRITDRFADDPAVPHGTEQLLILPESFLCIGGFPDTEIVELPACVRNGFVTYASFNNLSKLTSEVVRLWARILDATPGSKMLIMSKGAETEVVQKHLFAEFSRHGIEPDRLLLRNQVSRDQYLLAHNDIDIMLDTFPFNGGTITAGALWMGVPVVTLVGSAHRQRVGYSMLKNIGVEETIAWSEDQYLAVATSLANDPQRLATLRQRIARNMRASILCDAPRFTRQLEDALTQAWQTHASR